MTTSCSLCKTPYSLDPSACDRSRLPVQSSKCYHQFCFLCVQKRSPVNAGCEKTFVSCPQCGVTGAFDPNEPIISRVTCLLLGNLSSLMSNVSIGDNDDEIVDENKAAMKNENKTIIDDNTASVSQKKRRTVLRNTILQKPLGEIQNTSNTPSSFASVSLHEPVNIFVARKKRRIILAAPLLGESKRANRTVSQGQCGEATPVQSPDTASSTLTIRENVIVANDEEQEEQPVGWVSLPRPQAPRYLHICLGDEPIAIHISSAGKPEVNGFYNKRSIISTNTNNHNGIGVFYSKLSIDPYNGRYYQMVLYRQHWHWYIANMPVAGRDPTQDIVPTANDPNLHQAIHYKAPIPVLKQANTDLLPCHEWTAASPWTKYDTPPVLSLE